MSDKKYLSQYDDLECPICDTMCKATKELKNGTVVYESHSCEQSEDYYFSIDVEGNLVE